MKTSISLRTTHTAHEKQRKGIKKIKPAASEGLKKLFLTELKDAYCVERMLVEDIPKLIKNATDAELIKTLRYYHKVSEEHLSDLEAIFYSIRQNAVAVRFEAMSGLINDLRQIMKESENGKFKDFEIISGIRKIELYKITTYGILSYFAKTLMEEAVISLLHTILSEERTTDTRFSEIAETYINAVEAVGAD